MSPIGPRTMRRLVRPATPVPYHRTERDHEMLRWLARLRYLTTEQIALAVGCTPRAARARLHRLFADDLVDRPLQQATRLASHWHTGALPTVHALSRKSARLLEASGTPVHLDWSFRTGSVPALQHALQLADFMLALYRELNTHAGLAIVDHHDLLSQPEFPVATRAAHRPFALAVTINHRGKKTTLTNVPDRLFSIVAASERLQFAIEIDRATESIDALSGTKASIRRKVTTYYHAFRGNAFRERWGFERLRVLFVTPSEARITNMMRTQEAITEGNARGMFLYTTPARIAAAGVLGPIWRSADADNIALLPPSFTSGSEPRR